MYIGYFNDRQELGFSCSKDIHAIKQLLGLKSTIALPGIWMVKKCKQTLILIFSKEVLIVVLIFNKSIFENTAPYLDRL
jgi:hypothetical protein